MADRMVLADSPSVCSMSTTTGSSPRSLPSAERTMLAWEVAFWLASKNWYAPR